MAHDTLHLKFHGRIIDQLGSQTYQSLTGSIAELIANSWDADATTVKITLPDSVDENSTIVIEDNGVGLTFDECNEKYLNIGWCKRGKDPKARTPTKERPYLGRKGIGKFAGFGIAKIIKVETISAETGEKTRFSMNLDQLVTDDYIGKGAELGAEREPPDESRKARHGTKITLERISIKKFQRDAFPRRLAGKFLLHRTASDFKIYVNDEPIPEFEVRKEIEYRFPEDYGDKIPQNIKIDEDGFGIETLPDGRKISWKIYFFKEPIPDDGLRGVTIFANGKLAQQPFFFKSQSTGAQTAKTYMAGIVKADYVDELNEDLMSAERLRINWESSETLPLLEWGQEKINELQRLWSYKRGEKRRKMLEDKLSKFADQLKSMERHESKTIKQVLAKLGSIEEISDKQYQAVGNGILISWKQGRLRDLVESISSSENFTSEEFLKMLVEAQVVSALNIAETIITKLASIKKLRELILNKELEAALRDHIATNPWLISPKFETFTLEKTPHNIIKEAGQESERDTDEFAGRIDLVLKSNTEWLVLEFMKPDRKIDWDHLNRFQTYVSIIRTKTRMNTALKIEKVTGYLITDKLTKNTAISDQIDVLKQHDMFVFDWNSLLYSAESEYENYLEILKERGNSDRINSLQT